MKNKNVNIFGLGPTGAIIARRYAEKGYKVNCYEVRDHIAGNLFDYKDTNGVLVHKYGPHIFQTSDKEVIKYIKKFADWIEFRHKVNVSINNMEVPLPINFESIDKLFSNSEEIKSLLNSYYPNLELVYILDLLNSSNEKIKKFGQYIYKNIFENYTIKMWGIPAEKIDTSVLKRVPIRLSYDDGYFTDAFQAVPKEGYTKFIEKIIDHKNIKINLSIDKNQIQIKDGELIVFNKVDKKNINVYTGPIDSLFDYEKGEVPYRSLRFELQQMPEIFNSRYVVNYPSHKTMTRITDYRLLSQSKDDDKIKGTTISREYPGEYKRNSKEFSEPYYPINNETNNKIVELYLEEAKEIENLLVIGRLAEYKYKQMSQSIKDALKVKLIY